MLIAKGLANSDGLVEKLSNHLLNLTSVVLLPPTGQIQAATQAYYQKKTPELTSVSSGKSVS